MSITAKSIHKITSYILDYMFLNLLFSRNILIMAFVRNFNYRQNIEIYGKF